MGTSKRTGVCLCGTVTVVAAEASNEVGACHCSMCRGWSGGPFVEVDCGTSVEFSNVDAITVFNSSDWAERGFCSNCGTHLFYRIKETGQTIVPVGIFPGDETLSFERQVFIDQKPHYYSFAEKTEDFTGEQVFAMFGGGD
ncbi:GFA family protein [Altererythrobacter sp. MF3-039]|uniref:GFA family protein n=1 Tax=Altererythrobacter sp. MF3-039 TaxID=3252901 RepID=UPI00390C73DD